MKKKKGRVGYVGAAGLSGLMLLSGCATPPDERDAADERLSIGTSRDVREVAMQKTWIGRTHDDLLRSFGTPAFMLEVPGGRLPHSYIVVFTGIDRAGQCIDAFVVLKDGSATIWNYFCR